MATIPTEPQADDTETIMAALAHGMSGNPKTGFGMLKPFFNAPAPLVSLCAALAESSAMTTRRGHPDADSFGLIALHGDTPVDSRTLPAGPRFAVQFFTAWMNGDKDTAYALFDALAKDSETNPAALGEGVWVLYEMAVASMCELTGRSAP